MGLEVRKGFFFFGRKKSVLVLWTRVPAQFTEAERAALGPTYRRLLLERPGYIARAFERAMGGALGPFEALKKFAEENRAALLVTEPQKIEVPHSVLRPAEAKAGDVFHEAVTAFILGTGLQELPVRGERAIPRELPEPWMIKRQFDGQGWAEAQAL